MPATAMSAKEPSINTKLNSVLHEIQPSIKQTSLLLGKYPRFTRAQPRGPCTTTPPEQECPGVGTAQSTSHSPPSTAQCSLRSCGECSTQNGFPGQSTTGSTARSGRTPCGCSRAASARTQCGVPAVSLVWGVVAWPVTYFFLFLREVRLLGVFTHICKRWGTVATVGRLSVGKRAVHDRQRWAQLVPNGETTQDFFQSRFYRIYQSTVSVVL